MARPSAPALPRRRSGPSPRRRRRARSASTSAAAPGSTSPTLRRPVVALDAAHAMVRLAREAAPDAWPVQADLEALPFRASARSAPVGRARATSTSRTSGCRLRFADLHRRWSSARRLTSCCAPDDTSGALADDDFPGRWFSAWTADDARRRAARRGVHGRLVRDRRRRRVLARGPGHARPDAARHRRARHAPARVRPEPERVLGRRRRRLRPARATASGPRRSPPGSSRATATRATRSSPTASA